MRTSDFDYNLPPELIAQFPLDERDKCKLLRLSRTTGETEDCTFSDLPHLLKAGDRLVFNDTRVIPARLFCRKESGGKVELLLTEPAAGPGWKTLVRPGRGVAVGCTLRVIDAPEIVLEVTDVDPDGSRQVVAAANSAVEDLSDVIAKHGVMALPHYIKRSAAREDALTYQTIFAKNDGAIASPTAGLHFTPRLMQALADAGIAASGITLHVGIGTFLPVKVEDPRDHSMHVERYYLSEAAAREIEITKKQGGRIIAVGTTAVRVLEHCGVAGGAVRPGAGTTGLKILPGYEFLVVDGMITNFHVPKSTLLMLVSAFAGKDAILNSYAHAAREKYRFFSYGDAMLIV
jgi:S-adenosylmethionine:tRNA ribosyltransferase-isomerase